MSIVSLTAMSRKIISEEFMCHGYDPDAISFASFTSAKLPVCAVFYPPSTKQVLIGPGFSYSTLT